ncbi:ferredoxin--NADP reductase [Comamonas sp. AG1104]|uniref:ferredoxin--NADP reductase n=1 Tax=Comamonas sp. AG1104 TaxID=2183900 RepID=UPI000E0A0D95|nr:ferredoxin--NADP reductase [Comamonas sp. AG1104]RDI10021.1 3-ketosteroid 9alpha-monooxygenase subunit B [Comamonas sp. AG1104]
MSSEATTAASRYHPLRVRAVIDETHDTKSIVFEVPEALAEQFSYRPGQFLTLRLLIEGRYVPRCYSMSSAPMLDDALRVTVKRVDKGRGSNWVCDRVQVGDSIELMPPSGLFSPRNLSQNFLLLAGGSGITPVFSILRAVLKQHQGNVVLFYANRDERSVIFRKDLQQLAAEYPDRLQVIHWLDSVQGVPSQKQLAAWATPWVADAGQAFICGPGPFMDAAQAAVIEAGMPADQVHVERFVSLPDEEALQLMQEATAPVEAAVEQALVQLRLDGEEYEFNCSGTETILEAGLRAGINVPYSCQAGMCASCMCQVQDGSVHLRHNEVLDAKDLSKKWTLACQSVPTSEKLRVKFPE